MPKSTSNSGARGYVVKIRAAIDLLVAVEAVVEGRQFVSGGLSGQHFRTQTSDHQRLLSSRRHCDTVP